MAMGVMLVIFSIGEFGFNITGPRLISVASTKREEAITVSRLINARLLLLIPCVISSVILISSVSTYREEFYLMIFSFMIVLGQSFTPNWFFIGKEKNQFQSLFHFLSRVFYFLAVWYLINSTEDYQFVNFWNGASMTIFGILAIFTIIKKYDYRIIWIPVQKSITFIGKNSHIFLANFLSSVHRNAPIIIGGLILTGENLGLYSVLDKVILAIVSAFIVIYNSLYPRICSLCVAFNGQLLVKKFFFKYMPSLTLLVLLSALVFAFIGADLIAVLSEEIHATQIKFEVLLIAIIPIGLLINLPISLIIVSFDIQHIYLKYSAASAISIVVLGITLGLYLGFQGLIIAIFITEILTALMGFIALRKYFLSKNSTV